MSITHLDVTGAESGLEPPFSHSILDMRITYLDVTSVESGESVESGDHR